MIAAFLIIWVLYTVHAVFRNLFREERSTWPSQAMQTMLVLLAFYWAWQTDVFSRSLWSPLDIGAGLLAGHLLFALSLMITHQHWGDVKAHFMDWRGLGGFLVKTPEISTRFFGVAAVEELVYRVAAQGMLLSLFNHAVPAIGISALGFCLLHTHFLRNGIVSALEFLLFTLIIGVIYDYTASLTLVVLVHLVRNLESAYLEYCALLEENHDEAEALRILSSRHASLVLESV